MHLWPRQWQRVAALQLQHIIKLRSIALPIVRACIMTLRIPECLDWIDAARGASRQPDSDENYGAQKRWNQCEDNRVQRLNTEEEAGNEMSETESHRNTDHESDEGYAHTLKNNHVSHIARFGAQGEANAHFLGPLLTEYASSP